jgi:hypothetical protein
MDFVIEIARIYPNRPAVAVSRSNHSAATLEQAIAAARSLMASENWPASANGFRILDGTSGDELYTFSD